MFAESYTKFYVFIILALVLGFIGMEVATTGIELQDDQLSGRVTETIDDTDAAIGADIPNAPLIFLLIGGLAGAIIVGTVVYIYHYEKKRL